ncbi:hypothetical protein RhiirC2_794579 [Rhizophagus irregularis]|uniref:Uncharacterized protein n=1 Tax=Rhizophagus irregularis TaxID=588596 RepID=A0A2N1MDB9_9GLOM|nr:hypothetical protein RhiirC2_794579 [Rhizophagus irregularis]
MPRNTKTNCMQLYVYVYFKDEENSVRQYQPGYHQRKADAIRSRPNETRYNNKGSQGRRNDDVRNYGDDEQEMYEWDEGDNFEDVQSSNTRASILTRPRNVQNRSTNSIHRAKQTTKQISLYMQITSSKGKEKVNETNNNAMGFLIVGKKEMAIYSFFNSVIYKLQLIIATNSIMIMLNKFNMKYSISCKKKKYY